MDTSDSMVSDLASDDVATVREILDDVIHQIGGPNQFAHIIATDLQRAPEGSQTRIRLTTALLRLLEQTQPQLPNEHDLEALQEEEARLVSRLEGEDE